MRRFTEVDHDKRVAIVATVGDEIIGVGRYDRVSDAEAEVAFTVRDDHQGRGLGSVLLEHLAAAARERGVDRFVAEVLPGNRKMLGTFAVAGYTVAQEMEEGVVRLAFDIEPTDAMRAVARSREQRAEAKSIARLFRPSSVAVIGASRRKDSMGNQLLQCAARRAASPVGSSRSTRPPTRLPGSLPTRRCGTPPVRWTWPSSRCRPTPWSA